MSLSLSLTLHATECVTGFCARLSGEGFALLIDLGMVQGSKTLKASTTIRFPSTWMRSTPKLMRADARGPSTKLGGSERSNPPSKVATEPSPWRLGSGV